MPLPKIEYPLYEVFLHSLGRKIKARPFTVKEEKILLIAKEANDADSAKLAIKQIINNCVQDKLDIDTLPLFDIEMLFVKLRAKSVGESVKLSFNCQNIDETTSKPCNADTAYVIDLEKVNYVIPEGHDPKIMITDDIGIKLKYLSLDNTVVNSEDKEDYDTTLKLLLESIEYTFDKDSVTKPEDCTEAELLEFIESITPEVFEKIKMFFRTSPKVVLIDKVKCSKCGYEHSLNTEGLLDFFI